MRLHSWAKENNKPTDLQTLSEDENFYKDLADVIDSINSNLSNIEKVRRFIIATSDFNVANTMLTPSMKIRRHKIIEIYGQRLRELYGKN